MNQNRILLISVAMLALMSACAPIYKCGDPIPDKKPGGKKLQAVVEERDLLCSKLAGSEQENADLKRNVNILTTDKRNLTQSLEVLNRTYSDLIKSNNELQIKYKNLTDQSLSQAEQYNRTLQMKSEELSNKERLLMERERALQEMQQVIARQDSITKRLNGILRNALLGFNADELSVEIKNGKVYVSMSDRLLFKSGSAAVEDKGKQAIKLLADVLNSNPDIEILVEGHTDNVPIRTTVFRDNWDLSVARATSIVRILTDDHNITPTRVTASGRGEYVPRAANDTPEGRALNRRTEIILSPKLDEIMQLLSPNQ